MMELTGLTRRFDGVPAVSDVTLTVRDDEYLTLLGPSGAGKSTLLRLIAGLERPDSGSIRLNGEDITHRPTHTRGLGFVQQSYALFPHISVFDNVAFGLRNRLVDPVTDETGVKRRVDAMLELVGLSDLGQRMPGQLSGGQKQRVSLARTLVTEPKICLLDEPLGALDANLRERMTVELRRIREALGVTFMHVTGNEAEALAMGDRMIVLDRGRAVMIDAPDTVYARPATVAVAKFLNAYNVLDGKAEIGGFRHGDVLLPLPEGAARAAHYAVRYDLASIEPAGGAPAPGRAAMPAAFIAREFLGSRVVYFLHRPDGGVFEVERHLSRSDPVDHPKDAALTVTWAVDDVLAFDASGRLIETRRLKGAA
ncbi:MAG: ABC transporter ATP-binding protein [Rhodobacteraceae bacterium]|nr:MAG: ABC transporter ATP-binding protein [Paracoccaceae bacterium]